MNDSLTNNFAAALRKLEQFVRGSNDSEIERAGIIQAFEFTFEQCWKTLQKKAATEGVVFASPKKAFEWALGAQFIPESEEQTWLSILADRNLTTHAYREEMALLISQKIKSIYVGRFRALLDRLDGAP